MAVVMLQTWKRKIVSRPESYGVVVKFVRDNEPDGLCDGVLLPDKKFELIKRIGLPAEAEPDVIMKMGGLNHFSWVTEFRHGETDLMPALLQSVL